MCLGIPGRILTVHDTDDPLLRTGVVSIRDPGAARRLAERIAATVSRPWTVIRAEPERQVVFFAVGFETTAPAVAMAVYRAREEGVDNLSFLVAHVLVPPAVEAIAADPDRRVHGFLAAGHVCAVMGTEAWRPLAARHRVPIVVTGFEPLDLLQGLLRCLEQLERGRAEVENAYRRAVSNPHAVAMIERVFEVVTRDWRGVGILPDSGLALRPEYAGQDAVRRFGLEAIQGREDPRCRAGQVLVGALQPADCPEFGRACAPEHPLGAPMVSAEGACAAWYRFRRHA